MTLTAKKVKISRNGRTGLLKPEAIREGTVQSFDGTKIAYRSVGKGEQTLICCNGLGVSTFFWTYLERAFRDSHRVITWDYRGHGKSELKGNPKHYNIDALVKDCKAVVDKLELKKPIFIGHSLGVQITLEFYRRWSEKMGAIVSCYGSPGHPMDNFFNMRISRTLFRIVHTLGTLFPKESNLISKFLLKNPLSFWLGGLLKITNIGMVSRKDADRYIDHILNVDPLFFTMLLKSAQDHTAEDILREIKIPTLIIAGEHDQFTPMWLSKKMHRLIPKSEILVMQKATHAGLVEQPDLINLRIEKFIRERVGLKK